MKILQVRFKNLNSLEGEWEIDFSHPAYTSNGIFAITGPTGSGKTTLLDAICLALYGRTPRLKIVSKSVNEVMTRQTGECFAEVVFATLKGVFRCHWSHHRARKKPEGELQQPRHEIVNHETNTILENMIKNVAVAVEDVTGMNYDQFTQSIMLAQGDFAIFLQATAGDRAPLLEQITGTAIYSRISQKVHHYTANQQKIYTRLKEDLDSLSLLSTTDQEKIETDVADKLAESEKLQKDVSSTQKSIDWLERIEILKTEILNLEDEYSEIQEKLQAQTASRSALQKAKVASLHIPRHQGLQRLQKTQQEESKEITQIKEDLSSLKVIINNLSKQKTEAIQRYQHAEEALQDERKIIMEVKTLDARIQDRRERKQKEEKKIGQVNKLKEQSRANIDTLSAQFNTKKKELVHFSIYLEDHQNDSILVEKLDFFKEKNEQLQIRISSKKDLQVKLNEIQLQRNSATDDLEKIKQAHAQTQQDCTTAEADYFILNEDISVIRQTHPQLRQQHEQLTSHLSQLQKLSDLFAERMRIVSEISRLEGKIEKNDSELNRAEQEEKALLDKCVAQEQIVTKQEEILVLNRQIKSYEEERATLREGIACPLCGSTTHPFSDELPPVGDSALEDLEKEKKQLLGLQKRITELQTQMIYIRKQKTEYRQQKDDAQQQITSYDKQIEDICTAQGIKQSDQLIETLQDKIEKTDADRLILAEKQFKLEKLTDEAVVLRKKVDDLKEKHLSNEKQLEAKTIQLANLHEKEADHEEKIYEEDKAIQSDFKQLRSNIAPFGFPSFEQARLIEILEKLELRRQKWLEAREKAYSLEKELGSIENTLQKEETGFDSIVRECKNIQQSIGLLADELTTQINKRTGLYGEKDPDREEQRYKDLLSKALQFRDKTGEKLQTQENRNATLTDRLDRLLASTSKRATQIDEEQQGFENVIKKDGFTDVDDFSEAVMDEEQILELELFFNELDESSRRLQTILDEKKKTKSSEIAKNLSEESISSLQSQILKKNNLLGQILQEVGKLQGKLEENEKLLLEQQHKRDNLAEQEKELLRWQKLDMLIGSASGNKFRNFAQGITFEIMVELANKNLQKMSDRYILIRDSAFPLNLQVIDNYRAGDIRSTQNLSGGESFLVSLALALGLSNMAGTNVRVDSFFLDEGFGTLDEETLDIALQTLAGLQQDGKMIGIISHISLLKERLDTQIQLLPAPGGHSIIEGPGVRAL